jgi:hypothetical protein
MAVIRFLIAFIFCFILGYSVWTQTGPYAWVAALQLAVFGSYSLNLTFVLTLLVFMLLGFLIGKVAMGKVKKGESPGLADVNLAQDRPSIFGLLAASVVVLGVGLWPYIAPPPPIDGGELRDALARATLVPASAKLSLANQGEFIDTDNSVSILSGRSSSTENIYSPIHAPGSTEVIGIVVGSQNEWLNANIRRTPFKNEANEAAFAAASNSVLSLRPVPLIVRRHLASKNMPVPTFLPTYHWGNSVFSVTGDLIIGGGIFVITTIVGLMKLPKAVSV